MQMHPSSRSWWGSAHLFGDRVQCVQDVHGQFAGSLVAKLGVGGDGVLDEIDTSVVGRTEQSLGGHRISFVVGHVRSNPSCPILLTVRRPRSTGAGTPVWVVGHTLLKRQ